jgi:hypothetical protein
VGDGGTRGPDRPPSLAPTPVTDPGTPSSQAHFQAVRLQPAYDGGGRYGLTLTYDDGDTPAVDASGECQASDPACRAPNN